MICPKCEASEMWDNRSKNAARIANGEKPMPDYACKDKEFCKHVIWPPREEGSGKPARRGGGNGATPPQAPRVRRVLSADEEAAIWAQTEADYLKAYGIAGKVISMKKGLSGDYVNAIAQAATGMCIRMEKHRENPPPLPSADAPVPSHQPAPLPMQGAVNVQRPQRVPPQPVASTRAPIAPPTPNEFDDFENELADDGLSELPF